MRKAPLKTLQPPSGNEETLTAAPISRRSFIKGSAVLGVSSMLAGSALGWLPKPAFAEPGADIAAVKSADAYRNTIKPVEILGGMGKFVSKQSNVFINISIAKDHTGTRFSGTMKNMMGATSGSTNGFFHHGSGKGFGYYDDIEFLSQCIADVNLVRKPDLCILDGTEVLKTNGPGGPGKLLKPQKVFAGSDRVAMDVYGARLIGIPAEDIRIIQMAHAHGLGKIQLEKLRIQEVAL